MNYFIGISRESSAQVLKSLGPQPKKKRKRKKKEKEKKEKGASKVVRS